MSFKSLVFRVATIAGILALWTTPGLPQRPPKAPPTKAEPPAEAAVPFAAGETLDYEAAWNTSLKAATVRVAVRERRDFAGRAAWHFQARASTVTPLRYLFTLDDQFDSYAEPQALNTLQFEMYLREQRNKEDRILRFTTEGEVAPAGVTSVRVPRGTRDPLAALFALRAMDWSKQALVEMPVYDGRKLYWMEARVAETAGQVELPPAKVSATKIEIRVFDYVASRPAAPSPKQQPAPKPPVGSVTPGPASKTGRVAARIGQAKALASASGGPSPHRGRERTDIRLWLSLARHAARTPVLIEAQLPFGSLRISLVNPVQIVQATPLRSLTVIHLSAGISLESISARTGAGKRAICIAPETACAMPVPATTAP